MSVDKWVRRFSVDQTAKHKNGFTIYKITSVLFPIQSPEAVSSVSVWKRYSDVQRLHKSMQALHMGLHLRGVFPALPRHSYFKRLQPEVIEERAKTLKALLEFVAEHKLLFTSTDFVNFLQTGYPEPEVKPGGVINAIRSSLHLPIEETPPLEYQTDDDDVRSPTHTSRHSEERPPITIDETDFISQIPIYEATDVEIRESPKKTTKTESYESLSSIESIDSDLYEELNKLQIKKSKPSVKKSVLPDLIIFDAPSTSDFEDYHTMPNTDSSKLEHYKTMPNTDNSKLEHYHTVTSTHSSNLEYYHTMPSPHSSNLEHYHTMPNTDSSKLEHYHTMPNARNSKFEDFFNSLDSETTSLSNLESASMFELERRSSSKLSLYSKRSVLSLSNVECKTKTDDSYVFEAGYMLNLAARCEDLGDFQRAFECYKSGIEKMLIGVQTDSDPQRRALIKEKTNKYLSYAEEIYKNHLYDAEQNLLPEQDSTTRLHCPIPLSMLKRPYDELSLYRVLAVLGTSMMLVLHRGDKKCYAMKVIQKVPNNLTEFDEYFLQRTSETRSPTLPTVIPYMVPLHAYIETNSLIFLILSCAAGEKLFDYIKNYAKSIPNTPAREVNLENVFAEPKQKNLDAENNVKAGGHNEDAGKNVGNERVEYDLVGNEKVRHNEFDDKETARHNEFDVKETVRNSEFDDNGKFVHNNKSVGNKSVGNDNVHNDNKNVGQSDSDNNARSSVDEIVLNSQRLLLNVDKALTDVKSQCVVETVVVDEMNREVPRETVSVNKLSVRPRDVLPPSAICKWGAEILTALESLHNSGVICRDLNPSNILLGEGGQIILTYFYSYPGLDMTLSKLRSSSDIDMYIAPEIHVNTILDDRDDNENVCDFWSYGAIMYQLICGVPLSYCHRTIFTSHTILQLPDGMSVEEESLLTQLLTYDPSERLGAGSDGVEEIKRHPYFKSIDWRVIYDNWIVPD